MRKIAVSLALVVFVTIVEPAGAQSIGTYSWQLQPFCNNLTVNLTQQGAVFTVDGFDDQCGAPQRAPLVGMATQNPDGTIGFGLHIVTVPGGRPVDVDARISLSTLSGPWTDSTGNSGTFGFAVRTGGVPRPAPPASSSKLAWSGLTSNVVSLPNGTNVVVRTVTLNIPVAGQVLANASGLFDLTTLSSSGNYTQFAWCSISTGTSVETAHYMFVRTQFYDTALDNVSFAGSRVYSVVPGPFTVNLVCQGSQNFGIPAFAPTVQTAQLSALFVPN